MICKNHEVGRNYHTHQTVEESRRCWFPPAPPVAASRPEPTPQVVAPQSVFEPITDRQLWKVGDLGGDKLYAAKLSKGDASKYIEKLLGQPAAPVARVVDPRLKIIEGMIDLIPDACYATAKDGTGGHIDFLRLTRPTRGRFKGSLKIQTQHSERWKEALVHWPSGQWSIYNRNAIEMLLLVIADHKTCARRYSIEKQSCCVCNTELTDDRSRHYLIGPICDKKDQWKHMLEWVDDQNDGLTFEQLVARGKPTRVWQETALLV